MNSPLAYLGGKSRLAERIVSLIPADHTCYCEPFCGAAWVFFRKEPSKVEIINDMDGELVVFWRVIQNHLEEFLRYYRFAIVSRELFELANKMNPETLTDIQRAVRYFYLQKSGFGGKTFKRTFGTGATSAPRLNLTTLEEVLLEVNWRLKRVTIEHLDACECIRIYDRPETLFYLDPPYWKTAGYAVPFGDQDYPRLRHCLDTLKGRFILSLNDTQAVRNIFKGFQIRKVLTTYSSGNGRCASVDRSKGQAEVIIHNLCRPVAKGRRQQKSVIKPLATGLNRRDSTQTTSR